MNKNDRKLLGKLADRHADAFDKQSDALLDEIRRVIENGNSKEEIIDTLCNRGLWLGGKEKLTQILN